MKISAADVKKLRDTTGAGMMDCKKALTEAEGDFDKAIEILRKRGQKIAGKRADRDATEGVVISVVNEAGTDGISINLSAETDFVAKNTDFMDLAHKIAAIALENLPADKDALNALPFNDTLTVGEKATELAGVIGEKIEIKKYTHLAATEVVAYIHAGYRVGVLVGFSKAGFEEAGKNVAMQIAALAPVALDEHDIPQDIVEKERALQMEITRAEFLAKKEGKEIEETEAAKKKEAAMIVNITKGRMSKSLFQEKTLLNQKYVKDGSMTVGAYLKTVAKDLKVTAFQRMDLV